MKHPHYDVMMEWAADISKVVQFSLNGFHWVDVDQPLWSLEEQYRIKPTPKPDVVMRGRVEQVFSTVFASNVPAFVHSLNTDNVEFTFDGETGELKAVRMI